LFKGLTVFLSIKQNRTVDLKLTQTDFSIIILVFYSNSSRLFIFNEAVSRLISKSVY